MSKANRRLFHSEEKLRFHIFILLLLMPFIASAQGDLLITPHRVVLEGNKQIEEIVVANIGQDTAFYSISLIEYRMTDDGSLEEITEPEPGQKFASPILRYFPRSIELAPNESQVVRIQVRRRPGLEEGEYRSHLYFRGVPRQEPLGREAETDTTGIGIRLIPIYGISIPVIVRIGNLSASCTIGELALEQKEEGCSGTEVGSESTRHQVGLWRYNGGLRISGRRTRERRKSKRSGRLYSQYGTPFFYAVNRSRRSKFEQR